jgi:branched-chain amino acid transport system ATP-binding protein
MKSNVMLEVSALKVRYGEVAAVKGIDLSVPAGSIVVLLGANGAGKSSTLNAIVGLIASTGSITFEGQSIASASAESIVKRGMSLTPEGRRVFPGLTVADNLHLGGAAHASGSELAARIETELDRFPILRERYRQRAGLLSGGEQQMLAIARSLMSAPRLLFLDEPSLGLAPLVVDQVFDLISQLNKEGLTVLLVEQNAERALEIADYGYVLQSGNIVLQGTSGELVGSDLVKRAYLAE